VPVRIHAMGTFCNDLRFYSQPETLPELRIGGEYMVPIEALSPFLLPGQVMVSHCEYTLPIEVALKGFKKIYLYRDLREVFVSHARAENDHLERSGQKPISLLEFCQTRGNDLKEVITGVSKWRDHEEVLAVDFADLTSKDEPRRTQLCKKIADYMGWKV